MNSFADPIIDGYRTDGEENPFEWWYFDFDIEAAFRVYIEWHSPIFNLRNAFCTLIVRAHDLDRAETLGEPRRKTRGITKVFQYARSAVSQSRDHCHIVFPAGVIREIDGHYDIIVKEKGLAVDLHLQRQLPPMSAPTEVLYRSGLDDEYFAWNIPLPRAWASGAIEIDGRHIEVLGNAYHDHNWGTVNLSRHFRRWIWMRIFFNDYTFIFGDIDAYEHRGHPIRPILFTDGLGRSVATSRPTVEYRPDIKPGREFLFFPRGFKIHFAGEKTYTLEIETQSNVLAQEAPSGKYRALWLNSAVHYLYYFLRLKNFPFFFKSWLGLLHYLQAEITGTLIIDGRKHDTQTGKIEVFSCERKKTNHRLF